MPVRIADVLDICVIAVLLYFGLLWLKQRASRSLVVGIGCVMLLYFCAQRFDMFLTSWLFRAGFTAVLLTLVIVFQSDIRRAIERFMVWSAFHAKPGSIASSQTTDTLIEAVQKLAENRIGALIVIKGKEPLERHIRGGVSLNGRISFPLVYGLFNTQSPTHDGAVIIEGERIDKFAVYLPLTQNVKEGNEAGTRHAAGVGLSEVSDALVIIVSEERGTISVALHGKLEQLTSPAMLSDRIYRFYQYVQPAKKTENRLSWVRQNFGLKTLAVLLTVIMWLVFGYRAETIHRTFLTPIEWRNLPSAMSIESAKPMEARVSLTGIERNFNFDPNALAVSLDLSDIHDGTHDIPLTEKDIANKPSGLAITQIEPRFVKVKAYALTSEELPVKARTEKSLPKNLKLIGLSVEPEKIRVMIPQARKEDFVVLHTEPVGLDEITQSTTLRVNVVLPELAQPVDNIPPYVKVKIDVQDVGKKTK